MNKQETESFYCGVLVALGCVCMAGEDSLAEEIIKTVGSPYRLLRIARENEDPWLPELRQSIRYLQEQKKWRDR